MQISHSDPALPGRPTIGTGRAQGLAMRISHSEPALPGRPAIGTGLDPGAGYADLA